MTEPRLDGPDTAIYASELDGDASRYDSIRALPTEEALHIKFSILGTINVIVAIATFVLILAIVRYKKVRERPFNLYVLFTAIPDFISAFCCMLTCLMSAPKSEYYSEAMCGFQSMYLTFSFTCNAWMNAVIVYQVHKLLRYSNIRRRYFQPSIKEVFMHGGAVYLYAFTWGMLSAFNYRGFPLETHAYYGYACFPMEQDLPSTLFFYLAFVPMIMGIPTMYVFGASFHIYWYKLLPKTGRTRSISAFLLRIVFVYILVWTPFLLMLLVANFVTLSSWVSFSKSSLSHFQGFITTVVIYHTNPELQKSIRSILCLDCFGEFEDPVPTATNEVDDEDNTRWWSIRSRVSSIKRKQLFSRPSKIKQLEALANGNTEHTHSHHLNHEESAASTTKDSGLLTSHASTAGGGGGDSTIEFGNSDRKVSFSLHNDDSEKAMDNYGDEVGKDREQGSSSNDQNEDNDDILDEDDVLKLEPSEREPGDESV